VKRREAKSKEPLWIELRDVLAIHDRLLAAHGGAQGLRDLGLLQSALARPRQHHAYATQAVLDLASGKIDETVYTSWLRPNSRPRRKG
jgi:prophage maintenance system killer protein